MFKPIFSAAMLSASLLLTACHTTAINTHPLQSHQLQTQRWTLTHLGTNVLPANLQVQPYLQFDAASKQIRGSDGCNRIMTSYQLSQNQLHFSQLSSTKMMCRDANMLLASQFSEALQQVTSYRIEAQTLQLLDRKGQVLMQLNNRQIAD